MLKAFLVHTMASLWGSGEIGHLQAACTQTFLLVRVCTAQFSKSGTDLSSG